MEGVQQLVARRERAGAGEVRPDLHGGDRSAELVVRARPAVDLRVPEPVEREPGLERLGLVVTAQGEVVRRLRGTQGAGAELVVLEHLGVLQGQHGAGRAGRGDPEPPDQVHAEVEQGRSRRARPDRHRGDLGQRAHRRHRVGDEFALADVDRVHRARPSLVPVDARHGDLAGRQERAVAESGVDVLPVVELVGGDRARQGLPVGVGRDVLLVPVGEGDPEFGEPGALVGVPATTAAPGQASGGPAVADDEREHGRLAGERVGQVLGDVVRNDADAPLVARPPRFEQVVGDALPAEPGLDDAEGADVEGGGGDGAVAVVEGELPTQDRGAAEVGVGRDERCGPGGHVVVLSRDRSSSTGAGVVGPAVRPGGRCGGGGSRLQAGVGGQPLTAPLVMPATI